MYKIKLAHELVPGDKIVWNNENYIVTNYVDSDCCGRIEYGIQARIDVSKYLHEKLNVFQDIKHWFYKNKGIDHIMTFKNYPIVVLES